MASMEAVSFVPFTVFVSLVSTVETLEIFRNSGRGAVGNNAIVVAMESGCSEEVTPSPSFAKSFDDFTVGVVLFSAELTCRVLLSVFRVGASFTI